MGKAMTQDNQLIKGVRLPKDVIRRIEKIVAAEGSTFSQFLRTAAIRELNGRMNSAT